MTRKNRTLTIVTAGLLGAMNTTALAGPVEIPIGPVGDVIDAQGQDSIDYNCDGIINDLDLLALVASGSFNINTFLDMMASWGATDYDVNCDLIVNRDDMFQVVAQVNPDALSIVDVYRNHWGETGIPIPDAASGVASVPEPSTLTLATLGLLSLLGFGRRRRRQAV